MSYAIVQVNFNFNTSAADYEAMTLPMAAPLAETPGLSWKVWLIHAANKKAGGIYLFNDAGAAQSFAGQMANMLQDDLPFSNASIKWRDAGYPASPS